MQGDVLWHRLSVFQLGEPQLVAVVQMPPGEVVTKATPVKTALFFVVLPYMLLLLFEIISKGF